MNDIDLSGICSEESDSSWTPIGNLYQKYSGSFNGAGHTISGLYITNTADDQGLFGYVGNTGTVKNLTVSGTVSGSYNVGGIVGQNSGRITDCAFSGSVNGSSKVGGVVGYNNLFGIVQNCYNTGDVSGSSNNVGGVVGKNDSNANVENCYNTGDVSGSSNNVGGVVGQNGSNANVENCYNTGDVTGNIYDGGVVGQNGSGASVTNSYNTGDVTGNMYVGGVVGQNGNYDPNLGTEGGKVTGCYFLKQGELQGIGSDSDQNAEPVDGLAALCKALESDTTTWTISENLGRPVLTNNHEDDGTQQHPYRIFTADQLAEFRDLVNGEGQTADTDAWAKLMNDIDLSEICGEHAGESDGEVSWTPIGNSSTADSKIYKGTFDGQGHSVSGLYVNNSANAGLFGFVGTSGENTGTVKNLSVEGSIDDAFYTAGGVAAINEGNIENCSSGVIVTVVSSDTIRVGGIVGQNRGSITNCINIGNITANVSGNDVNVGGVVGFNSSQGSVINCYNTGEVSGSGEVGGVVGYNNSGDVTNCYFLRTEAVNTKLDGIGSGTTGTQVEAKTADEFASGEIAWQLQNGQEEQVWGQTLTDDAAKDAYPQLVVFDKTTPRVYKASFNPDYENAASIADQYTNGSVTLPTAPTYTGYTFAGWTPTGTTISQDTTFTAQWTANTYTVILNLNGGTIVGEELSAYTYGIGAKLPTSVTREGYTFAGWYNNADLIGNPVTEISTTDIGNKEYWANWTKVEDPEPEDPDDNPSTPGGPSIPSGPDTYPPTVEDTDNGSVEIDNNKPEAGDTVTITPKPDDGYEVEEVIVTDEDGNRVEVTENPDGSWTYTQPESDVTIEVIFGETEPEPTTSVSDIFTDVAPDAWYTAAIQYAYDNGLMTGVSDTEFAPEASTTRAMIVSILARLENVTSAESAGFSDVSDEWYATAVNWAASENIVAGFEDGTFRPNDPITREQLAAILMNYAAYKGEDVSARADLSNYSDQPSAWAEETMQWAVAEGLISGVTNTELQPQGNATRAQVAAILQRYLEM